MAWWSDYISGHHGNTHITADTHKHGNTYEVDVTKVVQPEVVAASGRDGEVIVTERPVAQGDGL